MIPNAIGTARNPGGLVSVVFDAAGYAIRETKLSPGVDVERVAEDDAAAFNAAQPAIAAIYDGDFGTIVATFRYDERRDLHGEYFGIPS